MRQHRRRFVVSACVFVVVLAAIAVGVGAGAAAPARASAVPHSLWWTTFGGAANSEGWVDVAKAPDGSLYAGGYHGFDEYGASGDLFVARFSASDNVADQPIWLRQWDNPVWHRGDQTSAIAVDHSGAVVVAGSSDVGGNHWEWVVVKWNPDGNEAWERTFAAAPGMDAHALDVACDAAGNVYVCGMSQTGAYDDSIVSRLVVRKLGGADGHVIWGRIYKGPAKSYNQASKLALDTASNVYCTGFGLNAKGGVDAITCKFRSHDGRRLWLRRIGGTKHSLCMSTDIAVRGAHVWVTGGKQTSASTSPVMLAKYTLNGKRLWLRTWLEQKNTSEWARALAVDAHGNAFVVGAGSNDPVTRDHAFILRWTTAGVLKWHRVSYDPVSHEAEWHDVICDSAGHVWVGGYTVTGGSESFAAARYTPTGARVWTSTWKGPDGLGGSCDALCFGKTGVFAGGVVTAVAGGNDAAVVKFAR